MIYKKILVGIDGSEEADKALYKAIEFKKEINSEIVIFHSVKHHYIPHFTPMVFPTGLNYSYTMSSVDAERIQDDYKHAGEKFLSEAKEKFEKQNLSVEVRLDLDESPQNYIKRIIKEEEFDLILLGYRGHHSKLRNAVIGSVPESTLNNIDCDLLVVK